MPEEIIGAGGMIGGFFGTLFAAGVLFFIIFFLIYFTFSLCFHTVALMMGAKVTNIEDRTFGKALTATFINLFLGGFLTIVSLVVFPILGVFIYFLFPCFTIKWVYACSMTKAVLTSIFAYLASISLGLLLIVIAIFATKMLGKDKEKLQVETVSNNVEKISPKNSDQALKPTLVNSKEIKVTNKNQSSNSAQIKNKSMSKEPQKISNNKSIKPIKTNKQKPKPVGKANTKTQIPVKKAQTNLVNR